MRWRNPRHATHATEPTYRINCPRISSYFIRSIHHARRRVYSIWHAIKHSRLSANENHFGQSWIMCGPSSVEVRRVAKINYRNHDPTAIVDCYHFNWINGHRLLVNARCCICRMNKSCYSRRTISMRYRFRTVHLAVVREQCDREITADKRGEIDLFICFHLGHCALI